MIRLSAGNGTGEVVQPALLREMIAGGANLRCTLRQRLSSGRSRGLRHVLLASNSHGDARKRFDTSQTSYA